MNVNIKLDDDQLVALVKHDLEQSLGCFLDAMEQSHPNIFSTNEVADKIMIMKHIEALQTVLDWYK